MFDLSSSVSHLGPDPYSFLGDYPSLSDPSFSIFPSILIPGPPLLGHYISPVSMTLLLQVIPCGSKSRSSSSCLGPATFSACSLVPSALSSHPHCYGDPQSGSPPDPSMTSCTTSPGSSPCYFIKAIKSHSHISSAGTEPDQLWTVNLPGSTCFPKCVCSNLCEELQFHTRDFWGKNILCESTTLFPSANASLASQVL